MAIAPAEAPPTFTRLPLQLPRVVLAADGTPDVVGVENYAGPLVVLAQTYQTIVNVRNYTTHVVSPIIEPASNGLFIDPTLGPATDVLGWVNLRNTIPYYGVLLNTGDDFTADILPTLPTTGALAPLWEAPTASNGTPLPVPAVPATFTRLRVNLPLVLRNPSAPGLVRLQNYVGQFTLVGQFQTTVANTVTYQTQVLYSAPVTPTLFVFITSGNRTTVHVDVPAFVNTKGCELYPFVHPSAVNFADDVIPNVPTDRPIWQATIP